MMKFIKYSLLTLFVAIVTDTALVLAYPSPSGTSYSLQLSATTGQWTEYRTKNTWSVQTYENISTFTWLTNPCPNCQIASKPGTSSGDLYVGVVTKIGQTKSFTDPTSISSPDDYRLYIYRFDTTLLTTYHRSVWMINA